MGLFDAVCAGSGLGLSIEDIALVLVGRDGERWLPVAPPIRGKYDGYGSIEEIDFDPTAQGLLAGFMELHTQQQLHMPERPWELSGAVSGCRPHVPARIARLNTTTSTGSPRTSRKPGSPTSMRRPRSSGSRCTCCSGTACGRSRGKRARSC